jgi:hypothetical protein
LKLSEDQSLSESDRLASDADASSLPSSENATLNTQSEWPYSVLRAALVAKPQSLTALSSDADASSLPYDENAMLNT